MASGSRIADKLTTHVVGGQTTAGERIKRTASRRNSAGEWTGDKTRK